MIFGKIVDIIIPASIEIGSSKLIAEVFDIDILMIDGACSSHLRRFIFLSTFK